MIEPMGSSISMGNRTTRRYGISGGLAVFFIKLILLPTVLAIVFAVFFIHNTSILNTKHDILVHTHSPKIVVVGGSNVLYGIDGGLIERTVPYSVVNYGLRAETPVSFYEKEISPHVERGDIILFLLEYGYFYGASDDMAVTYLLQTYPRGIPSLIPEYFSRFPDYARAMFPDQLMHYIDGVPERNNMILTMDQWGGSVDLLDYDGYFINEVGADRIRSVDEIDHNIVDKINGFAQRMATKGVHVALAYPVFWDQLIQDRPGRSAGLDEYLRKNLTIPVLGTPTRYAFPVEYLANSPYHVNRMGQELRTKYLLEDLEAAGLVSSK
jgi:hypothetical protein